MCRVIAQFHYMLDIGEIQIPTNDSEYLEKFYN